MPVPHSRASRTKTGSARLAPVKARTRRPAVLLALGAKVHALRGALGMTRKALAAAAQVSERHLASLEHGLGNVSVLVLHQVAKALDAPMSDLLAEEPVSGAKGKGRRIALVGLRGAGKSTLGQMLADDLECPFIELSREIEKTAGCSIPEVQALYGMNAYRRYERRALEENIALHPEAVIAVPGGLVFDPASYKLLLAQCTTVWLKAEPEDHMQRVTAQGDLRPMAASKEAMKDLRQILAARSGPYSKADLSLNTSTQALAPSFAALRALVRKSIGWPL